MATNPDPSPFQEIGDPLADAFVPNGTWDTIEAATIQALRGIRRGQLVIYYTGKLPVDRKYPAVDRVADEAERLARTGLLELREKLYGRNGLACTYYAKGL